MQCRLWDRFSSGWWSLRASHWRALRLPAGAGLASVAAVLVPVAPLWCALCLVEARRAGLGVDGGRCRGGMDCPNGGIGHFPSAAKFPKGDKMVSWFFFTTKEQLCTRVAKWDPTQCNDDMHIIRMGNEGYGRGKGKSNMRPVVPPM